VEAGEGRRGWAEKRGKGIVIGVRGFSRAYACYGNPAHFRCLPGPGAGIIFLRNCCVIFFF
jgi:hypothetical protein